MQGPSVGLLFPPCFRDAHEKSNNIEQRYRAAANWLDKLVLSVYRVVRSASSLHRPVRCFSSSRIVTFLQPIALQRAAFTRHTASSPVPSHRARPIAVRFDTFDLAHLAPGTAYSCAAPWGHLQTSGFPKL